MEKFLYPTHPACCIITEPSECGKSFYLSNLIISIINEIEKIDTYSSSLHQELYRNVSKQFSYYIPIIILPNFLNGEDIDVVIDEILLDEDFQQSGFGIGTNDSINKKNILRIMKMGVLLSWKI